MDIPWDIIVIQTVNGLVIGHDPGAGGVRG